MTKYNEKEVERLLALNKRALKDVQFPVMQDYHTACDQLAAAREIVNKQREALEKLCRGPVMLFPCPSAHSPRAYMQAVDSYITDVRRTAHEALRLTEESSDE